MTGGCRTAASGGHAAGQPRAGSPARHGPHTARVSRIDRWRGISRATVPLHPEECGLRYDNRGRNLTRLNLKTCREKPPGLPWPEEETGRSRCLDRARDRLTTGIHAPANAAGPPVRFRLTGGPAHDGRPAADRSGTVRTGHVPLADRAGDGDALRMTPTGRGTWANIHAMPDRIRAFPVSDRLWHPATPPNISSSRSNTSWP